MRKRSSAGSGGMKLSTDPQSVAARERRHRISQRFKILQSMVNPGGSKMDTVSMLEQAIHYVKFLKTQIWLHQIQAAATTTSSSSSSAAATAHTCSWPDLQVTATAAAAQAMKANYDVEYRSSSFPAYNEQLLPSLPSSSPPTTTAFYVKVEERSEEQQPPPFHI
ncbi:hypothetical protein ACLOJK_031655 [Asimina triloba]